MFTKKKSGLEKVLDQVGVIKKDELKNHKVRNGLLIVAAGSAVAAGRFGKSKEAS